MSNEVSVSKLDEILYIYRNRKSGTALQAKQQIKTLMLELIGEDEPLRDDEQLPAIELRQINKLYKARNFVRSGLRQKVEEL